MALALNRFPPQYAVEIAGQCGFLEESRRRLAEEMSSFLDIRVEVVAGHLRHASR